MQGPQGLVNYPGLNTFIHAEYVNSYGHMPGVCTLQTVDISGLDDSQVSPLTFTYGQVTLVLNDALFDDYELSGSKEGWTYTCKFLDRRWRWKDGEISGHYNLPPLEKEQGDSVGTSADPAAGDDSISNQPGAVPVVRPGTEKAPQDMATLCLQAMQEQNFDVSALPNDARPETHWSYDNPAECLEKLCGELGCRIVFSHVNDNVVIVSIGTGAQLPNDNDVTFASVSINPPNLPGSVKVVGAPTQIQAMIPLTAVGLDTDGKIKPLNQLSYFNQLRQSAPIVGDFGNISDPGERFLASQSCYRWFQVAVFGSNPPIQLPGGYTVKTLDDIVLDDVQIDTIISPSNRKSRKPAELWGWFDVGANLVKKTNTDDKKYAGSFEIDKDHNLVKTETTLYYQTGSGDDDQFTTPYLWLLTTVYVKDPDTHEPIRYTKEVPIDQSNGALAHIVKRSDVVQKYVGHYTLKGFDANLVSYQEVGLAGPDQVAQFYIDYALQEFQSVEHDTVPYVGLKIIDLDGCIQQVTYTAGTSGCFTKASRNVEHNPYVPKYVRRSQSAHARATRHAVKVLSTYAGAELVGYKVGILPF